MKVGDLVEVGQWGLGLISAVHWDSLEELFVFRIEFASGGWSLERETEVEVINENR